jgi:hypothetical protein
VQAKTNISRLKSQPGNKSSLEKAFKVFSPKRVLQSRVEKSFKNTQAE